MEYAYEAIDVLTAPLSPVDQDVLAYWERQRGAAFAPTWYSFRLEDLPPTALPWCSVVDVLRDPVDFQFRFWGTVRRDLLGQEITGELLSRLRGPVGQATWEENMIVVEAGKPIYFRLHAVRDGHEPLNYGVLRLPLSDDGEAVDKIFTMMYWPDLRAQMHRLHGTVPPLANLQMSRSAD